MIYLSLFCILMQLFIGDSMRVPKLSSRPLILPPSKTIFPRDHNHTESVSIVAINAIAQDKLTYFQTMIAGALSRTFAQTIMHPANTYKTILQLKRKGKIGSIFQLTPERLLRGADAQFLFSLPHGAFYFAVIDEVKKRVLHYLPGQLTFFGDFMASTISTIICSIVSTPQMVITDRLMAGIYPSFPASIKTIMETEGPAGFYTGWWPALAQKIPSYGLTWMFFQQMKRWHERYIGDPSSETNFVIGALAAAASVCVMIPLDTIKTRLVTQTALNRADHYKGMRDCFLRIIKEEGFGSFYVSLPPRLMSVVPMIAIQFGVYEFLKKHFEQANFNERMRRIQFKKLRKATRLRAQAINQGVKRVRSRVKRKQSKLGVLQENKLTGGYCEEVSDCGAADMEVISSPNSDQDRITLEPNQIADVSELIEKRRNIIRPFPSISR